MGGSSIVIPRSKGRLDYWPRSNQGHRTVRWTSGTILPAWTRMRLKNALMSPTSHWRCRARTPGAIQRSEGSVSSSRIAADVLMCLVPSVSIHCHDASISSSLKRSVKGAASRPSKGRIAIDSSRSSLATTRVAARQNRQVPLYNSNGRSGGAASCSQPASMKWCFTGIPFCSSCPVFGRGSRIHLSRTGAPSPRHSHHRMYRPGQPAPPRPVLHR